MQHIVRKLYTPLILLFAVWAVGSFWQKSACPWRWFTPVKPGQVWTWDYIKHTPFDTEVKVDVMRVVSVKDGYVKVITQPWYADHEIEMVYKKTMFNQTEFTKVSE